MSQSPFLQQAKALTKLIKWSYLKENKILCPRCSEIYYCYGFGIHLLERHTWNDFKIWWDEASKKFPNMPICLSCGHGFSSMHAMKIHLNRCLLKNVYFKEMTETTNSLKRKAAKYNEKLNREYKNQTLRKEIEDLRNLITMNYKDNDLDKMRKKFDGLDRSKVPINPSER